MNRPSKPCSALLLAALLGLALPLGWAAQPSRPSDIRLTSLQGKALRLSDFRGQWVVVNLWAPWCPLCFHEVPALNDLNARKDVVVIGIAMDYGQDEATVRQAIERSGMRYHAQVLGGSRTDANGPARQFAPITFYPTSHIYGPDGRRVEVILGPIQPERIQALIEARKGRRS